MDLRKTVSLRVETYDHLARLADEGHRPLSAQIEYLIAMEEKRIANATAGPIEHVER